jgi:hypothetical protein
MTTAVAADAKLHRVKIDDLDATLVRRTALRLIDETPTGVRTTAVAEHEEVAGAHLDLRAINDKTYHTLVGKILSKFSKVVAVDDDYATTRDMLWRRV